MTPDFNNFNQASNAIHVLQGAALLTLGLTEGYTLDNPRHKKINLAAPLVFVLSAAGAAVAMLYFLGGWNIDNTLSALNVKRGFYIFVAFACCYASAGLSRFTYLASDAKSGGWHYMSLVFLTAIAALYFTMGAKVSEEASYIVGTAHSAIGATLLAAVLAKFLHGFLKWKAFNVIWSALLLMTAFQLLTYRENKNSFECKTVTIQAGPEIKPSPVNPMYLSNQPSVSGRIPLNISGPRTAPLRRPSEGQAAPKAVKKDAGVHNKNPAVD